jgi:hypothetical protein
MAYNFLRWTWPVPERLSGGRARPGCLRPEDAAGRVAVRLLHRHPLAAGLIRLGTVALDGTKLAANAAAKRNRTAQELQTRIEAEVGRMLAQADQTDQREEQEHAAAQHNEALPAELTTSSGRLARLRAAKARLDAEAAQRAKAYAEWVAATIARAEAADRPPKANYRHRPRG